MKLRKPEILITAPSFLWLGLFVFIPFAIILAIAFKPALPAGGIGEGWSLDALRSLRDPAYARLLGYTVLVSAAATALCLLLALPVAWHLARVSPRWRSTLLMLVIIPFWTNFVIRVFAWQQILHAEGAIARLLRALGILGDAERLLGNSAAVIVVSVYTYLPFAILPIYAAAEKFDFHLLDAARDLGARPFRAFRSVFLPGIRKGLVTAFLIVFIPMLGSYVIPDMVGGTDTRMIGNAIAQRNFNDRNLPQAAALSCALTLLVLAPMILRRKEADA
jgi:ABC-type spermidine/putrescine transport system permease subunit I